MSNYFSYFPTTLHDPRNTGKKTEVTNILRRFKFRASLQDRTDVFYTYNIQHGDRPDTIAEKYYGSAKYAWIVLHFNNIIDPYFDWPLFDPDFDRYIASKYGSIATAQAQIKNYYKIIRQEQILYNGKIEKYELTIDETTYNSLGINEKRIEYAYDWEIEQNEKRKEIRLLEKRYLAQVIDEVETILQED